MLLGLWMLCACTGHGCRGCNGDAIAVLVDSVGDVQRDHAATTGQFAHVPKGERASFLSGDALRTLASGHARLQLPAAGSVLVQSDTTIRLWRGGSRALRLKVQTGDASVIASKDPLEIQTELGVAVLAAGSQLRVRPARRGQRYEVTMGRAMLTTPDGKQLTIGAGEAIGADTAADEPAEGSDAVPLTSDASVPDSSVPPLEEAAGTADLQLVLGASATIYDPLPPTAVQIGVPPGCPAGATLSLRGRPAQPFYERQTLRLPVGSHTYQVGCIGSSALQWRGTLRVQRNPGTAQLPRSAPHNAIDADGRTYTILFQNLLPVLEVRWPNAPTASAYTLTVQLANGRELTVSLSTPVHVFAAGVLPEGRHTLRFEAQRAGTPRSRKTMVDLRFDNASPTASLRAPTASGFPAGTNVHVAGIALPGAQVSVLGQRFALDAQQRFAGDVTLPEGTAAIAVRIQHPRTGTRYYIRRARAAP